MGIKYLWDTNIVIYYLQQQFPSSAERLIDKMIEESLPVISVINEIELLCWKSTNNEDIEILRNFVDELIVIELEKDVKCKTIEIRRKYNIKLADAIIAATALSYELILVTRNTSDFKKIEGLKLINPWDIPK